MDSLSQLAEQLDLDDLYNQYADEDGTVTPQDFIQYCEKEFGITFEKSRSILLHLTDETKRLKLDNRYRVQRIDYTSYTGILTSAMQERAQKHSSRVKSIRALLENSTSVEDAIEMLTALDVTERELCDAMPENMNLFELKKDFWKVLRDPTKWPQVAYTIRHMPTSMVEAYMVSEYSKLNPAQQQLCLRELQNRDDHFGDVSMNMLQVLYGTKN